MTGPGALVIEPLIKRHNRTAFSCGIPALDHYLARRAGQDVRRRIARVFVCTAGGADAVLGFYTLSALSIDVTSLPERLSRKLPRHPVPCALIGRLAIDRRRPRLEGRRLPVAVPAALRASTPSTSTRTSRPAYTTDLDSTVACARSGRATCSSSGSSTASAAPSPT